jgi:hypothetical protein
MTQPHAGQKGTVMHAHEPEEVAIPIEATLLTESPAAPKSKKKGKSKRETGQAMTLAELAKRYIDSLEEAGKSEGTMFSYRIELRTALKHFGEETLISSLTADDVRGYFDSAAVMKLKSGKPKAMPSYLKTQRVLRLALCWAEEKRWIEKAPIPESGESK